MEKCNNPSAWHDGDCCCNCANHVTLFKHPWNKKFKGAISAPTGLYACVVRLDMEGVREGIVFDREHGYCELHVRMETLKEPVFTLKQVKRLLAEQRHNCQVELNKRSVFHEGEWFVSCNDVMNAEEPEIGPKSEPDPEEYKDAQSVEKNVRMISQIEVWKLIMNPMMGRTEENRLVALSYDRQTLIDWMEAEKAPEPYYDEGPSFFHGGNLEYYKVFKKDGPLEWFNPLDNLDTLNHHGQGISSEWTEADIVRKVVATDVIEIIPKES